VLAIVLVMKPPRSKADVDLAAAMMALPELVESREQAKNARAEGRISTAAQFLADFESRHSLALRASTSAQIEARRSDKVFGERLSRIMREDQPILDGLAHLDAAPVPREVSSS
jgi:hypothetical protein